MAELIHVSEVSCKKERRQRVQYVFLCEASEKNKTWHAVTPPIDVAQKSCVWSTHTKWRAVTKAKPNPAQFAIPTLQYPRVPATASNIQTDLKIFAPNLRFLNDKTASTVQLKMTGKHHVNFRGFSRSWHALAKIVPWCRQAIFPPQVTIHPTYLSKTSP